MGAEHLQLPQQPGQPGLWAFYRTDFYISVLSSRPLGYWKEPIKKTKQYKSQQAKKTSICWKCWPTYALILLVCPWNFLHVLLGKCFISPNIREYLLWLYSIHIIIPPILHFREGLEKDLPGEYFTYLRWNLRFYQTELFRLEKFSKIVETNGQHSAA